MNNDFNMIAEIATKYFDALYFGNPSGSLRYFTRMQCSIPLRSTNMFRWTYHSTSILWVAAEIRATA